MFSSLTARLFAAFAVTSCVAAVVAALVADGASAGFVGAAVAGLAAAMLVGLVAGWIVFTRLRARIRRLTHLALTHIGTEPTPEPEADEPEELARLSQAIARMATRQRNRTAEAQNLRDRDLAILASMRDGVVAVNRSEEVVHINRAAESLLRLPPGVAPGRLVHEVIRVPGVLEAFRDAAQGRDTPPTDVHTHHAQSEQVIELHSSRLLGADGRNNGAVVVLRDVTELRRLESMRRDFVANVSHELKTPLTAIRSLTETLLEDDDPPPAVRRRFLEKISAQSSRLSTLVTDLLAISRLESAAPPTPEPTDLTLHITETARLLAQSAADKQIELRVSVPPQPVLIEAEDEAIRQMIGNLVDNAIKYTPTGGKVWVSLRTEKGDALIDVKDTGIGIEASQVERIFERFYRVDKARSREVGGTGLGLSIVKHVVMSLGGTIELQSSPGHGSLFQVRLPLVRPGSESVRTEAAR